MNSTFLHDAKPQPPDESFDTKKAVCETCGSRMWLMKIETTLRDGIAKSVSEYECKQCGTRLVLETGEDLGELAKNETR
jgi:transposase-like protein